jgi:lipoyl(octanoyl) transferase
VNSTTSDAICFQPPGLVEFPRAWAWQQQLQRRLLDVPSGPDAVVLLQHQPCYTLGRGADPSFLGFDPKAPPAPLHRIDRGGEVTFHGPGQLVLYPILDLKCVTCRGSALAQQADG